MGAAIDVVTNVAVDMMAPEFETEDEREITESDAMREVKVLSPLDVTTSGEDAAAEA